MKKKTAWIIALIVIPFLAAASVLHAQMKDEEEAAAARMNAFHADLSSLIESSEIDIQFTVTDTPLHMLHVKYEELLFFRLVFVVTVCFAFAIINRSCVIAIYNCITTTLR